MNNKHRTIFFFSWDNLLPDFCLCWYLATAKLIIEPINNFFAKRYNISFASLVIDLESEKTIIAYDKICLI